MSDKVLVSVELLEKMVEALRIANDWNLDELNIEPPEEWGLELPEDCNGAMEGWCYTTEFANYIESLIEAAPEPESADHIPDAGKMVVSAEPVAELEEYDAGYLNDFGGGNVGWWQDYIRSELGRAHDFYQSQVASPPAQVWVKCSDRMPNIGQKVDLYSNGVVQDEAYWLKKWDDGMGGGEYFWDCNNLDLDECPPVDFERDMWRERPSPPRRLLF